MPRVSKAQSEANHQAIEAAASRLFRERGLDGVSVSELMAEAGLTHGGFYAHYPCRTRSPPRRARQRSRTGGEVAAARRGGARRPRRATPSPRLSAHRLSRSCGGGVSDRHAGHRRGPQPATHPIHAAYLAGVHQQVELLADLSASGDRRRDRAAACLQLATMMGALLLARATRGDAISDEFLDAAREHLTCDGADGATRSAARTRQRRRGLPRRDGAS